MKILIVQSLIKLLLYLLFYHSVSKCGVEDPLIEVHCALHPPPCLGVFGVQLPFDVVGVGDVGGDGRALGQDELALLQGRDLSQRVDLGDDKLNLEFRSIIP